SCTELRPAYFTSTLDTLRDMEEDDIRVNTSNVTIDPAIFKAYDVRGIYGQDLTDDIAYCIGRAAAQYLNVPEIAVGRDMRLSSPKLAAALIEGFTDQGVNAIEIGMTTT